MDFILQNIFLVAIAVISGTMLLVLSVRRPGGRSAVNAGQATMLINREDALVVDVREPDEYVSGHVPDARNIPLSRLEERVSELDKFKDVPVILVCQTGARSADACRKLEKKGFTKLHNLEGGIAAWRTAGLPLKKGAKK